VSSRYFEFRGESGGRASSKFWEITVASSSVTTRYGRIGAAGQRTVKDFESPEAALRAADALIREKTRKGYIETSPSQSVVEADLALASSSVEPSQTAAPGPPPPDSIGPSDTCPSCRASYPSDTARFCAECGTRRASHQEEVRDDRDSPDSADGARGESSVAHVLRSLRPYRSSAFKLMVASSPNAPDDVLQQLAVDSDPKVSQAARAPRDRSAPSLPAARWWPGRKGADEASDPATDPPTLVALARSSIGLSARAAIVQRLDCPPGALIALATDCGYAATSEPDSGFLVRLAVARHPNTPAEAWLRLAAMELEPSTPASVLEELATHPRRQVQLRVARHRGLQGAARRRLISDGSASVRRAAARNLYLDADPSVIGWAASLRPGLERSYRYGWDDPARGLTVTVLAWHHHGRHEVMVAVPPVPRLAINRCSETKDGVWRLREHFRDAQSAITAAQRIVQNPHLILRLGEPHGLVAATASEYFYDPSVGRRRVTADDVRNTFATLSVNEVVNGLGSVAGPRGRVDLASAQRAAALCRQETWTDRHRDEVLTTVRAVPLTVGYWGPLKAILKSAPTVEIKAAALNRLETTLGDAGELQPQDLTWLRPALGFLSPRTRAFLQRSACRELHDLAVSEPDRFVALAAALLREQAHAVDYSTSPIGFYLLYGRLVPDSKPYFQLDKVDHPGWPDIQDRRWDLAPNVWDAHLDVVASIWESTATNTDVLAWAFRVLADGGRAPTTWSDQQIIALIERGPADLAILAARTASAQPSAIRTMPWPTLIKVVDNVDPSHEQFVAVQVAISDRLAHASPSDRTTFLAECVFRDRGRLRFGGPLAFLGWAFLGQAASDEHFAEALVTAQTVHDVSLADLFRAALVQPSAAARLLQWARDNSDTSIRDSFSAGSWAPDPAAVDRAVSQSPPVVSVLWSSLGDSAQDPAAIATVLERMPHTLASLAPMITSTVAAGLSEQQWTLVVSMLSTDPDLLRRDPALAVALATRASGWVQSTALHALQESQQVAPVWLALLESQSPPASAVALDYVGAIDSSEDLTEAVLAILDSGVDATRQDGLAALTRLQDRLDVDRVFVGLAEHEEGNITELVAEKALTSGLRDEAALRAFDRRVLLKRGGSRKAKRQIQERWMAAAANVEQHSMIDQSVILTLISHSDIEDQEWAFRMIAELAAQGVELVVGHVSATTDGAGSWSM
jgi:predicted DNA-binding WGR domain protein